MRFAIVTILAVFSGVAAPAAGLDLTGHWEGSYACSGFSGAKEKESFDFSLAMTQYGDGTLAIRLLGDPWLGMAIESVNNTDRGEIALVHCGSDPDLTTGGYTEFARFKASTSGARGSLSGTSLLSIRPGHIATCSYRVTRVDTIDPGLGYSC